MWLQKCHAARRAPTPALGICIPERYPANSVEGFRKMDRPIRTLLYELVFEPILRVLPRVLDFISYAAIATDPVTLPVRRRPTP